MQFHTQSIIVVVDTINASLSRNAAKKKVYKSSYDLEMDSMEIPQILLWI